MVQQQHKAFQMPNIAGKVMMVRRTVDPNRLGITLIHERLFSDLSKFLPPLYHTLV